METPLILLLGKNGQVGWELRRTLSPIGNILALDYPEIDFTEPVTLRRLVLEKTAPHRQAAAYTAVDKAESESDQVQRINGMAPGLLAEAGQKGRRVDDSLLDGLRLRRHENFALCRNRFDESSQRLRSGEAGGRSSCEIVRCRPSHLPAVLGLRCAGAKISCSPCIAWRASGRSFASGDQTGCPTWSRLIAEATAHALRQVLSSPDRAAFNGVYHLAASGFASWHEFASRIIELMPESERKCQIVEAISMSEYPTPAKRPANSVLNCDKLHKTFGLQLPHWDESLRLVLDKNV